MQPTSGVEGEAQGRQDEQGCRHDLFPSLYQKVIRTKVSRGRQVGRELSHGSWGAAVRPSAPLPLCAARLLWAISRALTRHQPQRTHPSREMRRVDTVCVVASFSHHVSNGENQVCPLLSPLLWRAAAQRRHSVARRPPLPETHNHVTCTVGEGLHRHQRGARRGAVGVGADRGLGRRAERHRGHVEAHPGRNLPLTCRPIARTSTPRAPRSSAARSRCREAARTEDPGCRDRHV